MTTPKGIPVPELSAAPNGPQAILDVATWLDDHPGISSLTYAQINALSGVDLWVGRVAYQTDTGTSRPHAGPYVYAGASWVPLGITDYWVYATSTSTNPDSGDGSWNTFNSWTAVEDDNNLLDGTHITVPDHGAGLWTFEAGVSWGSGPASGARVVRIVGSAFGNHRFQGIPGTTGATVTGSKTLRVVDGEQIHVERLQSSGSTISLLPEDGTHFFSARRWRA